jgi:hypothetical protein
LDGRFRDAQGRQHRRSTGEIDRKRASHRRAIRARRSAQGNPQRVRQTFAEFFRDHYGQDVPFLSVRFHGTLARRTESRNLAGNIPPLR